MAKSSRRRDQRGGTPGPGVDAAGRPVVDPTYNVFALVEAETKRQDDLRDLTTLMLEREMLLRAEHARAIDAKNGELGALERIRLDSIRTVDVAAVQRAAEVATEAVQTLAAQRASDAEAVRSSLASTVKPMLDAIAELQRAQYELQGARVGVADKTDSSAELALVMKPMVDAIRLLTEERSERAGGAAQVIQQRATWTTQQTTIGLFIAAAALLAGYLLR
ncbi:MAG TPA: hypothetical protein VLE97_07930 [Gaiellaceae bacterium]|nr:hypothetical protein [Gaiellaceae bacterium]